MSKASELSRESPYLMGLAQEGDQYDRVTVRLVRGTPGRVKQRGIEKGELAFNGESWENPDE